MDIQLTISLLASNRGAMLKRCLESIKLLLAEISSELIIVYTGDSTQVLETAREYTDIIIPFRWCNDFSAARNVGLEQAKGKWFLYLDDDEWFEDVSEICQFLKSGEERHYNSAFYIQRNYDDLNGLSYMDAHVGRMVRISPEIRFERAIHENLVPFRNPVKYFSAFVHHYGYCQCGKEKEDKKSGRNIPMLEQEIYKHPMEGHNYVQLAQEYYICKEYVKAEEYCIKGREIFRKLGRITSAEHWVTALLPNIIKQQGEMRRAFDTAEKIIAEENPCELVTAQICLCLLEFCKELKEYEKGITYIRLLREKLTTLEQKPELGMEQQAGTLSVPVVKSQLFYRYADVLECAVKLEDKKQICEILTWFPWKENGQKGDAFYPLLEQWKNENTEQLSLILECYHQLPCADPYLTFQRFLYAEHMKEKEKAEEHFNRCAETSTEFLKIQLFEAAVRNEYTISKLLDEMDLETWESCLKSIVENIEIADEGSIRKLISLAGEETLYGLLAQHKLLERNICRNMVLGDTWAADWKSYAESGLVYYQNLYNQELFEGDAVKYLPKKCRFLLLLWDAEAYFSEGNYTECVRSLSEALALRPEAPVLIERILSRVQKETSKSGQPQGAEIQALSVQLKKAAGDLVEAGQFAEAWKIVMQLMQIMPEDLELIKMKQKILRKG